MKKVEFSDELSFSAHLEELRWRFLYILAAMLVGFLLCYALKDTILSVLTRPLPPEHSRLTFLAPTEALIAVLKVAFFSGILISLPMLFYQIWCFVCPALLANEKKYMLPVVVFSTLFFFIGVMFAYFVVLPMGLRFLLTYGENFGSPNITLANYLSFIIKLLLAFGIVFELPLLVALLTKLGVITSKTLSKNRGQCIVGIFILSAILTPPDVATQILMSIPLLLLFEISIIVSKVFGRKKKE